MSPAGGSAAELRAALGSWWGARNGRERWMVGGGLALALVVLPYVMVWEPVTGRVAELEQRVVEERRDLAWMHEAAREVRAAGGGAAPAEPVTDDRSLLSLVDSSARRANLDGRLNRVQPDGAGSVRVWLDRAPFDEVVVWLDRLQRTGGVRVSALVVERTGDEGLVNARLTLEIDA